MPLKKKAKQQAKQDATEDDVEDKEAEKRKYTSEIETLQAQLKVLDEDEKHLEELAAIEKQKVQKKDQPTLNERQMLEFYGFDCKIEGDKFTFTYPTLNKDGSTERYFIQITEVDKERKLLKDYLPMSINMNDVLEKFPLNINRKIPRLFFTLKHLILCYQSRKKQASELKAHLKNFENCEFLYQDDEVRQVIIRFHYIENTSSKQKSNKKFHFDLAAYYEPDERLPRRFGITPAPVGEAEFDDDTLMTLKEKFAKPFRNVELKQGIDNIVQAGTGTLIWKSTTNILDEDSESSLSEDENSIDEYIMSLKKSKAKAAKKRKDKNEKESEESSDAEEKTKKDRRGKKRKRADMLDKPNEGRKRTQLTMDSFAIRKETSTKSLNATATEESDDVEKIEKRQTRTQTKLQENPAKKKKTANQSLRETDEPTDAPKAVKKSGKRQQRVQETELQENQSENEENQSEAEDQSSREAEVDDLETVKESEKHKETQGEMQENHKKNQQPAETPVKDVKKKKTGNQNPGKTAAEELKAGKKAEKMKKANDEAAQKNQEETEQPASAPVKSSVQKKKIENQKPGKTATDKEEPITKARKGRKSKEAAMQEIRNGPDHLLGPETEQRAPTPVKSSVQKKKIENQTGSKPVAGELEALKKSEKGKKAKDAAVKKNQEETEQPASTPVTSSVQEETIGKRRRSEPVAFWTTGRVEAPKKSEKGKKAKDATVKQNQEETEQPASTPVKISVQKKKIENQTRSKPAAGELEAPKKSEKRKKAKDAAVKENQEDAEQPALTPVKSSVQKKKLQNQKSSKKSAVEQEATTRERKGRKSKAAAIQEIQNKSSSWDHLPDHLLGPPMGSFVMKKGTANQSLKQAATAKQEITKKAEKRKKTEETEGDSENEEPAETSVKSPAKKKKKAADLSLNKSAKIDPKQTTLNFANKAEDAQKASKIPVMKKNKPKIIRVQSFSSSTPLVSKSALRSGKLHFSDISNISEIEKDD